MPNGFVQFLFGSIFSFYYSIGLLKPFHLFFFVRFGFVSHQMVYFCLFFVFLPFFLCVFFCINRPKVRVSLRWWMKISHLKTLWFYNRNLVQIIVFWPLRSQANKNPKRHKKIKHAFYLAAGSIEVTRLLVQRVKTNIFVASVEFFGSNWFGYFVIGIPFDLRVNVLRSARSFF